MLTVGSLFSGIGGLDLGLERAGMRVIWQSEIDPYASRVLEKNFPGVVNHGDIKRIDWGNVIRPDVLCGGYPCQPFSVSGKRQGEDDPRHLFPFVLEAISRLRPRYAILENVRGHLSMGGISVIGDLASIGYDSEWRVISAASVGANHRRDRIVIVSYPNSSNETNGRQRSPIQGSSVSGSHDGTGSGTDPRQIGLGSPRETSTIPDTDSEQLGKRRFEKDPGEAFRAGVYNGRRYEGYDGWKWWETQPSLDRVAYGIPARVDRLRGLGNAVVPQVAEVVGRLVMSHASGR